jgi:hypothetical protein
MIEDKKRARAATTPQNAVLDASRSSGLNRYLVSSASAPTPTAAAQRKLTREELINKVAMSQNPI